MRLKIIIAIYIVVFLVCGKILMNYFYNEGVIDAFEKGDYSLNDDLLLSLNYLEPYIAYYNNGNIHYKLGQYDEAIEDYQNALDTGIPAGHECPVRINMALSILGGLGADYKNPENIDKSLEILYRARGVLLEDDCANDEGTGHSKKAERLKRDIDAAIEELKQIQQQQQDQQNQQQQQQNQNQNQNQDQQQQQQQQQDQQQQQMQSEDKSTEEYMEQYQQQAQNDRQNDMDQYSGARVKWNSDYNNIW